MAVQPTPQPSGAQSGAGNVYTDQAGIIVPQGGDTKSMYNLSSEIAKATVTGSPVPVNSANPTAEQVLSALAHADPSTIAQVQMYLYKGGFYPNGTRWQDINLGVVRPDDISAFKDAVTVAAQTGSDLSDYIKRQAAWGVYTGATSLTGSSRKSVNVLGAATASGNVLTIEKPDPKAIGRTIDKEFQALLGHKPSAHERAGFIAAYTNAYQQIQIDNYNRQVAAMTGGGDAGAEPIGGSSAAPQYLPTAPDLKPGANLLGNIAKAGVMAIGTEAFRDSFPKAGAFGVTQSAQAGLANVLNTQTNARLSAQDQAFLALADKPLPGMPGYSSSGTGAGAASGATTVAQQQNYDPQAYADEWIQQHHTAEAGAHSATDVFSSFLNILHGGMQ